MVILVTILDHLGQHPLYGLVAMVGLFLGGFYGLEGWHGSLKEVDLRKSPRLRNFLWLIGAGATAFIADIHRIDGGADQSVFVLFYGTCAIVGIFCVVAFFAVLTLLSARHNPSSYGLGDALGDYLQFGYRYFRKRKEQLTQELHHVEGEQQRMRDYLKQLTSSITVAGADIFTSDRRIVARQLLVTVNQVVSSTSPPRQGATIRSNFMLVIPCTEDIRPTVRFVDDSANIAECLELICYDSGVELPDFRLPISAEMVLPGAPTALRRAEPIIEDNTAKISYPPNITQPVRKACKAYFDSVPFKSFASIRVVARGRAIGVVNVESTELEVFGSTRNEKEILAAYLMPFCAALGILFRD